MTPYFDDASLTVHIGDCRAVMAEMPAESVHCVVTSPPYWGLRDYGTATWDGGDAGCAHRVAATGSTMNKANNNREGAPFRDVCGVCGARRIDAQLGLEPTPEEYVAAMVDVFREVRRVLRDDGTVWLNLGDSYSQGGYAGDDAPSNAARIANGGRDGAFHGAGREAMRQGHRKPMQRNAAAIGPKPKDLVGTPWRVAFALQADGWYLRSDIIWSKPNPMPESVTDRPTKAHEYVFLLSKNPRYYFDADAVREPHTAGNTQRQLSPTKRKSDDPRVRTEPVYAIGERRFLNPAGRNLRSVWTIATEPYGSVTPERAYADGPLDTLSPDCPVHSLRAIRRSRQTASDDELLDPHRPRNQGNGSRRAPAPPSGQLASFLPGSPDEPDRPTTTGSLPAGSSVPPIGGSAPESRTPSLPTSAGGLGSGAGTESRTSRMPDPTTDPATVPMTDAPSAIRRNGLESRTIDGSAGPGSSAHSTPDHTPDTDAASVVPEGRCSCPKYTTSHSATFPEKLVEPCIKAGTSERGVCPECGSPWVREMREIAPRESGPKFAPLAIEASGALPDGPGTHRNTGGRYQKFLDAHPPQTTGWRGSCACDARLFEANRPYPEPVPATILDPFAGSGTVGRVANRLGRRAVLIDLSADYIDQAMLRNAQAPLGLGA